ncbi:unnamed protein product [Brachionus calyciflorus]|uniref:Uncharacterized protein n=1 Tax=Brachionus calyciflorus TaxID=104777 RepID=A0A814IBV9_9BILA|nr:unnamed protein product [Brachionus calyciflorus]
MKAKIGKRVFNNELSADIIGKLYQNDYGTRTDNKTLIGKLKLISEVEDDSLAELVRDALLITKEHDYEVDYNEIIKIKEVLKTEGVNRREELNKLLDINYVNDE